MFQIIDIDTIFTQTVSGNQIVEILKEETSPNDKLLNKINRQLCDFLTSNYGLHPSSFHKNLLAQSLVNSYPILASTTPDVPQALWFHPHGRGKYRHAGRIHYHMEYLSRRSGKRVVNRPRCVQQQSLLPAVIPVPEDNIEQLILEMKFLCPGPSTKSRAEELWMMTYADREQYRKKQAFHDYMKSFPVASSFDGLMISLDLGKMHPDAQDFCQQFSVLQSKVLAKYDDLLLHISNDFLRTLAIIRLKNPSRGVKRSNNETTKKKKHTGWNSRYS
nr:uncharacterized protein LOC109425344 [Aedes albopictus]